MNVTEILLELDQLFKTFQIDKVEEFLESHIKEAQDTGDTNTRITLMNEMIGFCRDTSRYEKAVVFSEAVIDLMKREGLDGSIPFATTLLNVANAYRAAGKLEEAMAHFQTVFSLYDGNLEPTDFRYASLNNNLSLLHQEMGDFNSAAECLKAALSIVTKYKEARIETAVTHSNLAASLLRLKEFQEAIVHLEKALAIFEQEEQKDYHYSGALSVMGEALFLQGRLEESAQYYQKALDEIEKNVGRTKAYEITKENLERVQQELPKETLQRQSLKGLDLCEAFFKEYGIPMLSEKFPEYQNQIAAGLVGEGSECFGYDDETSRDHDFGPGFCLWLTGETYEKIGDKLKKAYDELPTTYHGITRKSTPQGKGRIGIFAIDLFYEQLLGVDGVPKTLEEWLYIEDEKFAAATNGRVFVDELGEFTGIRSQLLEYYPESVRGQRLAKTATLMAQAGQYNYNRMLQRGETVTAFLALSEFMKHTMSMVYLLNRKYAPFYKWCHKGMNDLEKLPEIMDILNAIVDMPSGDERIGMTIEIIAKLIVHELKNQGLSQVNSDYLEDHAMEIVKNTFQDTTRNRWIEKLIQLEWEAFDQVKNEGGRADCQEDWNTFSIMRKSQYLTWTEPMLISYIHDFKEANQKGWNLMTEKYGRMMESTNPLKYEQVKAALPFIDLEKKAVIEEIVAVQVGWMEEFAKQYPKAAGNARSIHTFEDHEWNTSYETYLRGELGTYSPSTLEQYGRFIVELSRTGKNLSEMIMGNTALLYGYQSLKEMEEKI